jgi:hypothetical protein
MPNACSCGTFAPDGIAQPNIKLAQQAVRCARADLDSRTKELARETEAKKAATATIVELNQVVKRLKAEVEVAAGEARDQLEAVAKTNATHKEEKAKVRFGGDEFW